MALSAGRRVAERRVRMTFRIHEDVAAVLRERAAAMGLSQTGYVEVAVMREWRAERRRLAQQAALLDAEADRELAEAAVGIARETFGDPR